MNSSLESLPSDFLKTFLRHIKMLSFIGLDIFYERELSLVRKYAKFCMFNALFVPMLVSQVLYIALRDHTEASFLNVATAVPSTLMAIQALLACAVVSLFLFEMAPLFVTVREWSSVVGPLGPQYRYPLQSYLTHWLEGPWQYAAGYFFLMAASVITHMCLYIAGDLLLVSLTIDLSSLLDLLRIDLEEVVLGDGGAGRGGGGAERIKHIIRRHQKLLGLADELSNIFGLHVFVQVSFSSVIICCFGFLTVIAEGTLNNLFAAVGIASAIWILCWPGQLLQDTSMGVAEGAYGGAWTGADAACRRHIALIITRAQKPCSLTALGFSNLTLANFSKILSTSWSYLSLLRQMYQHTEEL